MEHVLRRLAAGGVATVAAFGLLVAGAPTAGAHVSVSSNTAQAGSYAVLSFSVPHGCDGSPTTEVAIQVPAGINAVTPTRNAFYTLEAVTETLDDPIVDSHGNEVTERVSEVVYTAVEPLPDGQRDVVELSLRLPEDAAGTTLYFPTIQTCADGEAAWVEIPADGQDPHDLALPAPSLVVEAAGDRGHDGESAAEAGVGEAAGMDLLATAALAVGSMGLLVGGAALLRTRRKA